MASCQCVHLTRNRKNQLDFLGTEFSALITLVNIVGLRFLKYSCKIHLHSLSGTIFHPTWVSRKMYSQLKDLTLPETSQLESVRIGTLSLTTVDCPHLGFDWEGLKTRRFLSCANEHPTPSNTIKPLLSSRQFQSTSYDVCCTAAEVFWSRSWPEHLLVRFLFAQCIFHHLRFQTTRFFFF